MAVSCNLHLQHCHRHGARKSRWHKRKSDRRWNFEFCRRTCLSSDARSGDEALEGVDSYSDESKNRNGCYQPGNAVNLEKGGSKYLTAAQSLQKLRSQPARDPGFTLVYDFNSFIKELI